MHLAAFQCEFMGMSSHQNVQGGLLSRKVMGPCMSDNNSKCVV